MSSHRATRARKGARVANRFLRERHARASSLRWLFPFLAPTLFHAARCHLFHKRGPLKGRFSFPPRLCAVRLLCYAASPLNVPTTRCRRLFLRACARDLSRIGGLFCFNETTWRGSPLPHPTLIRATENGSHCRGNFGKWLWCVPLVAKLNTVTRIPRLSRGKSHGLSFCPLVQPFADLSRDKV